MRVLRPGGTLIRGVARAVRCGERLGHTNNVRDDNPLIESQVEDWYFVPVIKSGSAGSATVQDGTEAASLAVANTSTVRCTVENLAFSLRHGRSRYLKEMVETTIDPATYRSAAGLITFIGV